MRDATPYTITGGTSFDTDLSHPEREDTETWDQSIGMESVKDYFRDWDSV